MKELHIRGQGPERQLVTALGTRMDPYHILFEEGPLSGPP